MTRNPTVHERVRQAMAQPDAEHDASGPMSCKAHGCPCTATLDLGGGWHCQWHAYCSPDQWQGLTQQLREHTWLLEFITDLQMRHRRGEGSKVLVALATTFWAVDPYMAPTAEERQHWGRYLWRLREELAYRVGRRSERPEPREPQCRDPKIWSPRVQPMAAEHSHVA